MSGWDIVDESSSAGGFDTTYVEGETFNGYNIKSVKKEKVVDTNPNLYLERAEIRLKEGRYDEALQEAGKAVKYSNNNWEVKNEFDRIKNAVDKYKENINPATYIKNGKDELVRGRYNEAIRNAELALKYAGNETRYVKVANSIKSKAENELAAIAKRKADIKHHLGQAKSYLNMKKYDDAINEVEKALSLSPGVLMASKLRNIKVQAINEKKYIEAENLLKKAHDEIGKGNYDQALAYAKDAVNCSDDKRIIEGRVLVAKSINNKKAEKEAYALVSEIEGLIDEGRYYEALIKLEKLPKITKGHECNSRFETAKERLEDEITQVSSEEKEKIADSYADYGRYKDARRWYTYAESSSAFLKLGKMLVYKEINKDDGIEFLEKSAHMDNPAALIELMKLNMDNKYFKRSLNNTREYYKELKVMNKPGAKAVIRKFKKDYDLSLYKVLRIKGQVKAAIFGSASIVASILIGMSIMFATGKWHGIVIGSSINIDTDKIGINQSVECKAEVKVLPFFAKYPERSVEIEDTSVASYNNGMVTGNKQGDTVIALYADGKEINRALIQVCETGVSSFKISYEGELNYIGDYVEPNIDISYFNDVKVDDVKISYSSSNSEVVKVIDNKRLVALKKGHANVVVKVNDKEKLLMFDIADPYEKKSRMNDEKVISYTNYTHPIYGFSIDIPNIFNDIEETDGGRSIHYTNTAEGIQLKIGGTANNGHVSASERYNIMLSNLSDVSYKFINNSSYVISYNMNGYSYYYHEVVGDKSINGFSMMCRIDDLDKYRSVIDRLYSTFNTPYVNASYSGINTSSGSSKIMGKRYNDGSYMFKDSDKVLLTDADVKYLNKETLAFLRNEICAKNGYIFKEEPYKSYFNSKSWYRGTKNEIDESIFNSYERKNIELIRKYENS